MPYLLLVNCKVSANRMKAEEKAMIIFCYDNVLPSRCVITKDYHKQ